MYHFVPGIYTFGAILASPLFLRDSETEGGADSLLKAATEDAELDEFGRPLLCAHCGHVITSRKLRTELMGSHTHLFSNPAGIQFEIGCFSQAPGCRYSGTATEDWTWFPGYSWRFAICANCQEHLGWQYLGVAGDSFYGLILACLVLGDDARM